MKKTTTRSSNNHNFVNFRSSRVRTFITMSFKNMQKKKKKRKKSIFFKSSHLLKNNTSSCTKAIVSFSFSRDICLSSCVQIPTLKKDFDPVPCLDETLSYDGGDTVARCSRRKDQGLRFGNTGRTMWHGS